jgi:hypothetical protein
MKLFATPLIFFGVIISGCSVVPLPDDVVGIDVAQISRKIRCEIRDGIQQKLAVTLIGLGKYKNDSEAVRVGNELKNGTMTLQAAERTGDLRRISPALKSLLAEYLNTGVAYNFNLQGTINNDLNQGTLNITQGIGGFDTTKQLVSDGSRMIGLSGGITATRDNIVNFFVSDDFFTLSNKVDDEYCSDRSINANYLYPIAGKLGLYKLIDEFVDLNEFGGLAPDPDHPTGPPTLAWTMKFTTGLSASANPQITLLPIIGVSRVTQASITGGLGRTDTHTLTVALSRETRLPSAAEAAVVFGGQPVSLSGTPQVKNALFAVQRSYVQNYLLNSQRPVVVVTPSLISGLIPGF